MIVKPNAAILDVCEISVRDFELGEKPRNLQRFCQQTSETTSCRHYRNRCGCLYAHCEDDERWDLW